jgi:hypothetical protein
VRHDQDRLALGLHRADGGVQGHRPGIVEVRVRLVEDQENRIAIKGPRQTDPLHPASRQAAACRRDPGVIALRKPNEHVLRIGFSGSLDNHCAVWLAIEPGDVLGDRAVEEGDPLRQIRPSALTDTVSSICRSKPGPKVCLTSAIAPSAVRVRVSKRSEDTPVVEVVVGVPLWLLAVAELDTA